MNARVNYAQMIKEAVSQYKETGEGFERIITAFDPLIYYVGNRRGFRSHEIQDLRQEVYLRVHKYRKNIIPETANQYLRAILTNQINELFRKKYRNGETLEFRDDLTSGSFPQPDEVLIKKERRELLEFFLEFLPLTRAEKKQQREVAA
jgi:DNA-directed RNA polymerase specialized sigma24 family protein